MLLSVLTLVTLQAVTIGFTVYQLLYSEEMLTEFQTSVNRGTDEARVFVLNGELQSRILEKWFLAKTSLESLNPGGLFEETELQTPFDIWLTDPAGRILLKSGPNANVSAMRDYERQALADAAQGQLKTKRIDNRLVSSAAIRDGDKLIAIASISSPRLLRPSNLILRGLGVLALQGFAILVLTAGIGFLASVSSYRATRAKLKQVENILDDWGNGNFSQSIDEHSSEMFSDIAKHLNQMSATLQQTISLQKQLGTQQERNKMILQLHDGVKQRLFALNLTISAIAEQANSSASKPVETYIENLVDQGQQLQHEVNRVVQDESGDLTEFVTDNVNSVIDRWKLVTKLPFEVEIDPAASDIDRRLRIHLCYILEEAISNVVRHAGASKINVSLRRVEGTWSLLVQDNGLGLHGGNPSGLGTYTMNTRATFFPGGVFDLSSSETGTQASLRWDA